jgi:hypothetical protein
MYEEETGFVGPAHRLQESEEDRATQARAARANLKGQWQHSNYGL